MSKIDIEGNVLDSFNVSFCHDRWAIDPQPIIKGIAQQLQERLYVCNKKNKAYAIYVVIADLEGDEDAISERKEVPEQKRFWRKRQA